MTEDIQDIQIGTAKEIPLTAGHILGAACTDALPSLDPRTLPATEKNGPADSHQGVLLLSDSRGVLADAIASAALTAGRKAAILTPVKRPLPDGAELILADRESDTFAKEVRTVLRASDGSPRFPLVVDCGGRLPRHARQDLELFSLPGTRLVFLSSDLVYDPLRRSFPTVSNDSPFSLEPDSPWTLLRQAEAEFLNAPADGPSWTILRPTITLASADFLCEFPPFPAEASVRLPKNDGAIPLVAGGHWLVQPLAVADLAAIVLALSHGDAFARRAIDVAGPLRMELRQLCQLWSQLQGKPFHSLELSEKEALDAHPEYAQYLCHRIYPLPWQNAPLPAPEFSPAEALRSLLK